jgi:acyl phosphate:glycerol-3-phosphate acyltransferase
MPDLVKTLLSLSGVVALAFGYLLGSIPFGMILTRLAGTEDLRSIGSGNIGATNVLRTGRKGLAAATLIGDALKGTAAVLTAGMLITGVWEPALALAAGFGAFLGHLFPVWLGFKGGKGVATYLGILLGLSWQTMLAFAVIWLGVAFVTRYSSLASLLASAATPIVLFVLGQKEAAGLFVLLTILVFIMHRANISRLLSGTEGKIGQKG